MSAIDDYWTGQSGEIRAQFQRLRRAHRDSDVKGTGNEVIVAELLQENFAHKTIITNSSIIDALDGRSDEVDIAVCNEYQPFLARGRAELLLVEGVDAVVQVKARLDGKEIERLVRNCRTVKQRQRSASRGDQTFAIEHDVPHFVNRVPYVGFAFESVLAPSTALSKLREACVDVPPEEQPDGIFVLGGTSYMNVRDNIGVLRVIRDDDLPARGFEAISADVDPLVSMMWCLYSTITHFVRWQHPVVMYNPQRR